MNQLLINRFSTIFL